MGFLAFLLMERPLIGIIDSGNHSALVSGSQLINQVRPSPKARDSTRFQSAVPRLR